MKPMTIDEVKQATFAMNSFKALNRMVSSLYSLRIIGMLSD